MTNVDEFKRDLSRVLNTHGLDSDLDTPDYILANFLFGVLACMRSHKNQMKGHHNAKGEKADPEWFRHFNERISGEEKTRWKEPMRRPGEVLGNPGEVLGDRADVSSPEEELALEELEKMKAAVNPVPEVDGMYTPPSPYTPVEVTKEQFRAGCRPFTSEKELKHALENLVEHLVALQRDGLRPTWILMNAAMLARLKAQTNLNSLRNPEHPQFFGVPIILADVFDFAVMTESNKR